MALVVAGLTVSLAAVAGQRIRPQPGEAPVPGQFLVRFAHQVNGLDIVRGLNPAARTRLLSRVGAHLVSLPPEWAEALIERLAARSDVLYVEPNRYRTLSIGNPDDPRSSSQYPIALLEAVKAWGLFPGRFFSSAGAPSARVRVAVLDTGLDCTHPDFRNRAGASADSALGGQVSFALSKAPVPTTRPDPACAWQDDHGHGTHVAGTVAAATHNLSGVAALGFPLELLIYKVTNSSGAATDDTLAEAIMAAADDGARVISMSLGGPGYSQTLQDAVTYAWRRNALVVAAAGNNNSSNLTFPAAAHHSVGVAATDSTDARASFSNFGPAVDLAAPGVAVLSTLPTYRGAFSSTDYGTLSGTSMSTPHAAALAGLLAAAFPGLSPDALVQRMQQTAQGPPGDGGWTPTHGYGVIRAWRALVGDRRVAASGSLVGQVVDQTAFPVAGAQVEAGGVSVISGSGGLFRLSGLTPGSHDLTVTPAGLPSASRRVTVLAGADTSVTVTLSPTPLTAITVTVTAHGAPVQGAIIEARLSALTQDAAVTDSTGIGELRVPPGTYTIRAGAPDFSSAESAPITVGAAPTSASLALTRLGRVRGRVRFSTGEPLANAQIEITGTAGSFGAVTDAQGEYLSLGLRSGSYQLTVSAAAVDPGPPESVQIQDNVDTVRDITVQPARLELSPQVTAVPANGQLQFTYAWIPRDGGPVTFRLSPAVGTISPEGLYRAPDSTLSRTVTVEAHSGLDNRLLATAIVFVNGRLSLILSATSVASGRTLTTNRVVLASAAPPGGARIELNSNNPAATPPASVTIAAGATSSPAFEIPTVFSNQTVTASLSARFAGMETTAPLEILAPAVASLTLSPGSVAGGLTTTANRVYLTAATPGVNVALSSSDPDAAEVPASVSVPSGSTSVAFSLTTRAVASARTVTITARLNGSARTAALTVNPPTPSLVRLSPAAVAGGLNTTQNYISLNVPAPPGGVTAALTSSDPTVATVPAQVVIAAGSKNSSKFTITTRQATASTPVLITAQANGAAASATLTVRPPILSSLVIPTTILAGQTLTTAKVNLDGPAPAAGATVALSCPPGAPLIVPASVTIPAGATSATFPLTGAAVTADTSVVVTATYSGVARTDTITVRPPQLSSLILSPSALNGGAASTASRVTITAPAPAGGALVAIESSHPAAVVPPSVLIPAGQTSTSFAIQTTNVPATTAVNITARLSGGSKTAVLTVRLAP